MQAQIQKGEQSSEGFWIRAHQELTLIAWAVEGECRLALRGNHDQKGIHPIALQQSQALIATAMGSASAGAGAVPIWRKE